MNIRLKSSDDIIFWVKGEPDYQYLVIGKKTFKN